MFYPVAFGRTNYEKCKSNFVMLMDWILVRLFQIGVQVMWKIDLVGKTYYF